MRAILICALATRCGVSDGRPAGAPMGTGIYDVGETGPETTGEADLPRLDLRAFPDLPEHSTGGEDTSTSAGLPTTSGAGSTSGSSGGEYSTSTGAAMSTATGSTGADTSTGGDETTGSTGAGDSSTGELTDCPCEPGADNVCDLAPGACSATLPGGICDPDGNGDYLDGDWDAGFELYAEKCG